MKTPGNNTIALILALVGGALTVYIFAASRNDPGLRMAALVAATGAASSLMAVASTLLTGKDLTKHDDNQPPQLPEGPAKEK